MPINKRLSLTIWLIGIAACAVVVARTTLRTDMAAFLPSTASLAQTALTGQASNGAAAHLILLSIENAPPPILAALSTGLATRLRTHPEFIDIANGGAESFSGVQQFVWTNRYLLANDITPARFTAAGLHAALETDFSLLGSDMGGVLQSTLPADPTAEILTLQTQLAAPPGPPLVNGVWLANNRAILLAHTAAPGFNIEAQQQDLTLIQTAFTQTRAATQGAGDTTLSETGPGVFAVHIQKITKKDVSRLSILATAGAVCLLLFAYRSPRVLFLGLLPVATGALAAIVAVSLKFGYIHGVTLGFGVTLIGESLDYAIYLFTQTAQAEPPAATLARIWPTLRLGAATSVVGFSAMLLSNFTGFAQLGLFSITGLIVAAATTRYVLPHLIPPGFFAPGSGVLARPVLAVISRRAALRPLIAAAALAAAAALLTHRGPLWDNNLANLSPIPQADQALDGTLRHALGVPDQRYFAVFAAPTEQSALQTSEALATTLQNQRAAFDVPSSTLPSLRTQSQRQAALPDAATLQANFSQASAGLPFRPHTFDPFFAAVATAKTAPLITEQSLPPPLALRVNAMLMNTGKSWTVIAPLTSPAQLPPGMQLVDLDHESTELLKIFQSDSCKLAAIGSLAILAVLLAGLRAPSRVAAIAAPLAAAVIVTAALLTLDGEKLSIFMVVGFLLIIAVGSNYCLFFARPEPDAARRQRAAGAILLANLCTVSAYGLMSVSRIPVLHDIGITVAIGTFLSLFFGAAISTPATA